MYINVQIFVCGQYLRLFREKVFQEHSSRKTVSFEEQIMSKEKLIFKHIFTPNGSYCVYYPSNIFHNKCSFENWGISLR